VTDSDAAAAVRRRPQQPELQGIDTNTGPMWAIACLPLVSALLDSIPSPFGAVPRDVTSTAPGPSGFSVTVSLVLLVVAVLLAVADRRILRERGIIRPLHPAWELFDPVYVIGRAVVVHRRVRGSLSPLWVWVATSIASYAISGFRH
jgi:hypothetical protein